MEIRDRIKELRRVPAGQLQVNPKNWRTHPKAQRDALRGILADVGYVDALLAREAADGSLLLIDGHLRAETTPDTEVPVLILDVNEEEADKILATFDPLAGMAEVDKAKLDALLREVDTGSPALQQMLEELAKASGIYQEAGIIEDVAPPPPEKPVSRLGDLWTLGDHRLLCGDSTNPDDVGRLFSGRVPFLMVTDPPYGFEYDPTWRDAVRTPSKRNGKVRNDHRADWTPAWRLFPGNVAYVWHGGLHSATVQRSLQEAGFLVRAQIVWAKPQMALSRGHYHWKHEPCFHGERVPGSDPFAYEDVAARECEEAWYSVRKGASAGWNGGRKQTTVWEIGFAGEVTTEHGTQKPVECMARPVRNHGEKSDIVYDPFGGSGTTLIACEQLGRPCVAMELDPRYVDVHVARWEAFTKRKAVRECSAKASA